MTSNFEKIDNRDDRDRHPDRRSDKPPRDSKGFSPNRASYIYI
jgi:hypothetical protein